MRDLHHRRHLFLPFDVDRICRQLGDRAVYEKSLAGVRETISPDGLMPAGAQENCLKFLAAGDPKIAADVAKIKLEDTWTNEFAQRAKKHS